MIEMKSKIGIRSARREPSWRPVILARSRRAIVALAFTSAMAISCAAADELPSDIDATRHWAFQPLNGSPQSNLDSKESRQGNSIDGFVRSRLAREGLAPGRQADRHTLVRRVSFTVTGLPPTPDEIEAFSRDRRPDAYELMVEGYLSSPRYGERWGKHWLDAAGYADSNGYFSADSDRPLAYRYRDYVIRSLNRDLPFDQFIREQLAGDELARWKPGQPATPEIIELLEATHFLRNGQDGSGESDGNPDEVRTDRYYALESAMQIIGSSLLGLTVQCAKCHDHKFEPLTQRDYYAFQAFLYPAFNIDKWIKPNDRVTHANLPGELEAWQASEKKLDAEQAALRNEFNQWFAANRPRGEVLFTDSFSSAGPLSERWSNTAPGDDGPGGSPAVTLDSDVAPAAQSKDGSLLIIEGGGTGDRWICTKQAFAWRPPNTGDWIQVTFDLVDARLAGKGKAAERVAYFIAAHDFDDSGRISGGNILIDGNPGGPTSVHVDYPGGDAKGRGSIGGAGYTAGRNYGVRVTRAGANEFMLEHLADGAVDGASVKLKAEDLPAGGFGFEYCCGRSFVVDNVSIEASKGTDPVWVTANNAFQKVLGERRKSFETQNKGIAAKRAPKPGRIAWMTDTSPEIPIVPLLKRGNHKTPGEAVDPAVPAFLAKNGGALDATRIQKTVTTSGRRLAFARWLTEAGSPQAALLARVTVNRIWQQYFGVGLVATPENLGLSGAKPTHPELIDWLAAEFVESGWSQKAIHRAILDSATFRQASAPRARALRRDPDNHLLWRYPVHRLDAEAIRDAMLSASGRLGSKTNGPYVPTPRSGGGEVMVDESKPDAFARSVFLQQRRTQVATFLGVFDAPSVVFNCTRRAQTTMPLQSLSLLNSEFALRRAADLAQRLEREGGNDATLRLNRAFLLVTGRVPDATTLKSSKRFLDEQRRIYAEGSPGAGNQPDGKGEAGTPSIMLSADQRAWADLCQMLFASNEFLYLE